MVNIENYRTALTTERWHGSTTDKYEFVSTKEVNNKLMNKGFYPVSYQEANVVDPLKHGYQTHMIRYRKAINGMVTQGQDQLELVFMNGHDGTVAAQIHGGMNVYACLNKLIFGDASMEGFRIIHRGSANEQIDKAIQYFMDTLPKLEMQIKRMKNIEVNKYEQLALEQEAQDIRYDDKAILLVGSMLLARRKADVNNTLWSVFNKLQENMVKGYHYIQRKTKEEDYLRTGMRYSRYASKARAIKGLQEIKRVNKELWDAAVTKAWQKGWE